MNTPVFDSTREMDASIFLESNCSRVYADRAEFITEAFPNMYDNEHVYMLYIGGGYCPLAVAVVAFNESDAVEAMQEYMREHDREEEIGEDVSPDDAGYGEYELTVQQVPDAIVRRLTPPPPPEPITRYHRVSSLAGAVVFGRRTGDAYRMTGNVRKTEGSVLEVEVHLFDVSPLYRYYLPARNILRLPR